MSQSTDIPTMDASMTTTTTTLPIQSSRLLNLPGEIRNRIYHFVAPTEPLTIRFNQPRSDRSKPQDTLTVTKAGRRAWFRRGYLGATQVCRQLRAELFPLCNTKIEYHVWLRELEMFMEMSLHDGSMGTSVSDAGGNLVIGLNMNGYGGTGQVADLLPLVKLCRAASATSKAFKVRFEAHSIRVDWSKWAQELGQFFDPEDEAKWDRFTEQQVTAVVLSPDVPLVEIFVKEVYFDTAVRPMDMYGRLNQPLNQRLAGELARMRELRKAWEESVGLHFSDTTQNTMRIRMS